MSADSADAERRTGSSPSPAGRSPGRHSATVRGPLGASSSVISATPHAPVASSSGSPMRRAACRPGSVAVADAVANTGSEP